MQVAARLACAAGLVLAACDPPARAGDCDAVGRHLREISGPEIDRQVATRLPPTASDEDRATARAALLEELPAAMAQLCRDKRWRRSHTRCLLDAPDFAAAAACGVPE